MAKEKGNVVKTYKFKVCPSEGQADMLRRTAEEYRQCYNRLSEAVCERLTSVRIGEMCTEADQTTAYARDSVSDANRACRCMRFSRNRSREIAKVLITYSCGISLGKPSCAEM